MIQDWINEAIGIKRVSVARLAHDRVESLIRAIEDRYTEQNDDRSQLWERFQGDVSRKRSDGWSLICDYASRFPILLYAEENRYFGLQFACGDDLRDVLSECPGIEVFVMNENVDYVLCHNHHDYLIGVGSCTSWVADLNEENSKQGK